MYKYTCHFSHFFLVPRNRDTVVLCCFKMQRQQYRNFQIFPTSSKHQAGTSKIILVFHQLNHTIFIEVSNGLDVTLFSDFQQFFYPAQISSRLVWLNCLDLLCPLPGFLNCLGVCLEYPGAKSQTRKLISSHSSFCGFMEFSNQFIHLIPLEGRKCKDFPTQLPYCAFFPLEFKFFCSQLVLVSQKFFPLHRDL